MTGWRRSRSAARRMTACGCIYDGDDKLFLPVENIELLSRYGCETTASRSTGWAAPAGRRARREMKKRIRDMAGELIRDRRRTRSCTSAETLAPPEGI